MADTVATLITEVVAEGQFDATDAQALNWLNRRHRQMVAEARSLRRRMSLGSTVVGQSFYAAPAVEVFEVDVGGAERTKIRRGDVSRFAAGEIRYTGNGFFAEDSDTAGVNGILLLPAPTVAGQAIETLSAVFPSDLAAGDSASALKIDPDMYDALVSGAIATGLVRLEQRADLAAPHENLYTSAVQTLKARTKQRYQGSGATQIRIAGINA